jgi:hypothetical protein
MTQISGQRFHDVEARTSPPFTTVPHILLNVANLARKRAFGDTLRIGVGFVRVFAANNLRRGDEREPVFA